MAETVGDKIMTVLLGSAYYAYNPGRHHGGGGGGGGGNHCGPAVLNETLDVLRKTCFTHYDTLACIRGTVLVFLIAVTGMLCATRVVSLHVSGHPNYYQYAIFYLAVIRCIVSCVEWVIGWTVHATLICLYLRCLQLVVICHFYLTLACRVTRRSNGLASRLSAAVLSLFLTYFTSFMIIGLAFSGDTWCDCFANYWLFMSGGQLVLIQMFCTAAFLIIHRVNEVQAQESFKKAQKRGVLILVFAFEMSAVVSITYHVVLVSLGTEEGGCSGIFLHKQWIYSPVRLLDELLTSLLPLWAMLYVFKPLPSHSVTAAERDDVGVSTDRRQLIRSSSGDSQDSNNMMDPSLVTSPSMLRAWRRRRAQALQQQQQQQEAPSTSSSSLSLSGAVGDPASENVRPRVSVGGVHRARSRRLRSLMYGIRLFPSSARSSSTSSPSSSSAPDAAARSPSSSRIRRCCSAPSTLRNKRTPPLATIPEEPASSNQRGNGSTSSSLSSTTPPPLQEATGAGVGSAAALGGHFENSQPLPSVIITTEAGNDYEPST